MCFAPQRCALFQHLNLQKWREHVVFCTFWLRNVLRTTTACTFRHRNFQKWSEHGVLCTFWLGNVLRATTACTFSTSQLPKVVRQWCVLCILTWKCASRHNGMHFSDISTSKSGPTMVFCTFWLGNVLRATRACNFSSLVWPDGSAPAALASLLFDPLKPQIIEKTQCFATFLPFRASASSFFWLFLFSLTLSISAFHLSILSEVWTSKLPSIILSSWKVQVNLKFHGGGNFDTSSTAQGGGGSFKNRKAIGEIGCCESGMAERKISFWSSIVSESW